MKHAEKVFLALVVVVVVAIVAGVSYSHLVDRRNERQRRVCHSHLALIMHDFVHMLDDERILPEGTDFAEVCRLIDDSLTDTERKRKAGMNLVAAGSSLYCPVARKRDKDIGYVYVGEGMRLGEVKEKDILIVFCAADYHAGWSPVWHARDGTTHAYECGEIVDILERAIERGKSGEVHYSRRAMNTLRQELSKRLLRNSPPTPNPAGDKQDGKAEKESRQSN